jgi:hypothetical protein|tara:strand:+ start:76 stop:204 length:129 start_codon:yes stop_codon:yes gene_type:complete
MYGDGMRKILENHYKWCLANGRDISWYGEYRKQRNKKSTKVY